MGVYDENTSFCQEKLNKNNEMGILINTLIILLDLLLFVVVKLKKKLPCTIEYDKTTKFTYSEIKCVNYCDLCVFFLFFFLTQISYCETLDYYLNAQIYTYYKLQCIKNFVFTHYFLEYYKNNEVTRYLCSYTKIYAVDSSSDYCSE